MGYHIFGSYYKRMLTSIKNGTIKVHPCFGDFNTTFYRGSKGRKSPFIIGIRGIKEEDLNKFCTDFNMHFNNIKIKPVGIVDLVVTRYGNVFLKGSITDGAGILKETPLVFYKVKFDSQYTEESKTVIHPIIGELIREFSLDYGFRDPEKLIEDNLINAIAIGNENLCKYGNIFRQNFTLEDVLLIDNIELVNQTFVLNKTLPDYLPYSKVFSITSFYYGFLAPTRALHALKTENEMSKKV